MFLNLLLTLFYFGLCNSQRFIADQRCGINNRKLIQNQTTDERVQADRKDWPWMAAILKNKDSGLICWGVLITDRHVLAAASCFRNYNLTGDGNIALAKLERPASFSKFISPVCLPPRSETLETRKGIFI
ncbi:hypothetical protein Anas_11004, partial [Armadillidium nasatum]